MRMLALILLGFALVQAQLGTLLSYEKDDYIFYTLREGVTERALAATGNVYLAWKLGKFETTEARCGVNVKYTRHGEEKSCVRLNWGRGKGPTYRPSILERENWDQYTRNAQPAIGCSTHIGFQMTCDDDQAAGSNCLLNAANLVNAKQKTLFGNAVQPTLEKYYRTENECCTGKGFFCRYGPTGLETCPGVCFERHCCNDRPQPDRRKQ